MNLEALKARLYMMLGVTLACFVLAAAALVARVVLGEPWLLAVCMAFIGGGVGAQVWFLVGWMRSSKADEGRAQA